MAMSPLASLPEFAGPGFETYPVSNPNFFRLGPVMIANALVLLPLLLLWGTLALAAAFTALAKQYEHTTLGVVCVIGLIAVLCGVTFLSVYFLRNISVFAEWFYQSRMRRILMARESPLFAPEYGRLIEIVPREHWGSTTKLEDAVDSGYTAISADRQWLLWEGGNFRFRLHGSRIRGARIETIKKWVGLAPYFRQFLVLLVETPRGYIELPLRPRQPSSGWGQTSKMKRFQMWAEPIMQAFWGYYR